MANLSCASIAFSGQYQKKIVLSEFLEGTEEKQDNSGQYNVPFGHNLQENMNQYGVLSADTVCCIFTGQQFSETDRISRV
jgi:hypothetical protein